MRTREKDGLVVRLCLLLSLSLSLLLLLLEVVGNRSACLSDFWVCMEILQGAQGIFRELD